MANKTIELNKSASSGTYIIGKIVCDATADNTLNNSDVTCRIYVRKDNDSLLLTIPTSGTWAYSMTINGKAFSGTVKKDVLLDWVLLATVSVSDIAHADDGTKSISISGYVTPPSTSVVAGHKTSGSGTFTLDTVPRASAIDTVSCASRYFNGKLTYKYTPQSASLYNQCNISLNLDGEHISVKTINLGKKSASQQTATVTLTEDEQAIIYNELPNTDNGTLLFTFRTYSNSEYSNQIGDAQYKEILLFVPKNDDTLPDVGATLNAVHSLGATFDGLYVQGKTKVKATFAGKGKYGAAIKSYSMSVGGEVYNSSDNYTSEHLAEYGTVKVNVTATDSRGYSNTESMTIYVIAYAKPKILPSTDENAIICARCDKNGNVADAGTYLKIKARRSYSKCFDKDGVQRNFCLIRYRYKTEAGSYTSWKTLLAKDSMNSNAVTSGALLNGTLDVKTTYIVQVGVLDDIGGYQSATFAIGTEEVYMHRTRRGLGIGMYVQDEYMVDIDDEWDVRIRGGLEVGGRSSVSSLKAGISIPSGSDLNDYKTPGNYFSSSADVSASIYHSPYSRGGFGLEIREFQSANYISQTIYYGHNRWIRHWNAVEWSEWVRFQMTTVEESISTNFVVSEGTTDSWYWRKFANGIAECWRRVPQVKDIATDFSSVYMTECDEVDFPFAFAAPPIVSTSVESDLALMLLSWKGTSNAGTTTVTRPASLRVARFEPATGVNFVIAYHAIGRWK